MPSDTTRSTKVSARPIRVLPDHVANRIAAGEVVERPASVVKELIENALDARATRIAIRLVAAGRKTIEVADNGHGMSEQDGLLAIERHATSKIRKAEDLDNIATLGFRGEALASIAAVSRFEMVTRRAKDASAMRIRVDGGVLRDVGKVAAPAGTRVTVNRLYFNTPVRAKFLKGVTTELSQCIDCAQRYAMSEEGVAFQFLHNEKVLFEVPANASLRERAALIWGLGFVRDLVDIETERAGLHVRGLVGTPALTRSQRSHQFFFLNRRPVLNRSLQYGFEDAYQGLLTIGRHPVGILLLTANPRTVDVNIHPAKREVRFRDERLARDTIREAVRGRLALLSAPPFARPVPLAGDEDVSEDTAPHPVPLEGTADLSNSESSVLPRSAGITQQASGGDFLEQHVEPIQTEFGGRDSLPEGAAPAPVYHQSMGTVDEAPMQLFDTYLLVPQDDRLLIIDQHALHERLSYDALRRELKDADYAAQQLAVPLLIELAPSQVSLVEANRPLLAGLGIEIEPFGGTAYQVTAVCHLYEESRVPDVLYRVLDALAQGDLFNREDFLSDLLRLTVEACRGSVKAGDRLSPLERRGLLEGFRRIQPPYTCPHGRPIITELTMVQMEKSFRRRQ